MFKHKPIFKVYYTHSQTNTHIYIYNYIYHNIITLHTSCKSVWSVALQALAAAQQARATLAQIDAREAPATPPRRHDAAAAREESCGKTVDAWAFYLWKHVDSE